MPRKPTHGGARPGAGRPVSTGADSARPVHYRVSADQRAELDNEGKKRGISGDLVAKLRCFPHPPRPQRRAP